MFWNRNVLLMDIRRTSGSLLMTFWKIFNIGMTFFQNYRKKSSATRKFFKKSSEVNQMCAWYPLTTYSGFRSFWWLFPSKKIFFWKKQIFLEKFDFFSSKRKNHETSMSTTARYMHGILKISLWKIISVHRRMRSTCFYTTHMVSLDSQNVFGLLKKSSFWPFFDIPYGSSQWFW